MLPLVIIYVTMLPLCYHLCLLVTVVTTFFTTFVTMFTTFVTICYHMLSLLQVLSPFMLSLVTILFIICYHMLPFLPVVLPLSLSLLPVLLPLSLSSSILYNVPATSRTYNISTQPPPPPTFVAAAAAKESSLEPRPKNPKIQALLDEIVNDDPRRNVSPQEIHNVFSIVPPSTTSPSPKKVSTPPTPPHHIQLRNYCYRHRNRRYRNHQQ